MIRPVPAHPPPEVGLLTLQQVLSYVPVSKANWYRRMKSGEVPLPASRIGSRPYWDSGQIRKLLVRGIRTKVGNPGKVCRITTAVVAREGAAGLEVLLWQRPARVVMPLLLCLPWKLLEDGTGRDPPWALPWQPIGELGSNALTMTYKGRWTVSAYGWHALVEGDLPAGITGMWCRLAEVPTEQMMGADALILRRYRELYGKQQRQGKASEARGVLP